MCSWSKDPFVSVGIVILSQLQKSYLHSHKNGYAAGVGEGHAHGIRAVDRSGSEPGQVFPLRPRPHGHSPTSSIFKT